MNLRETINADYIVAFKEKNAIAKNALSGLKAKIQDAEKAKNAGPLTDELVLNAVISTIKQRRQSIEEYTKAGRFDLVESEANELSVIEKYLPKQMTRAEIETEVNVLLSSVLELNKQKLIGMTMGAFVKKFPGLADPKLVREVIESLA
jgi:uncharacterized protein YqeY